MIRFSDVVAHGDVISGEPRWDTDAGAIYTHVTIELRDVMKGPGQRGGLLEIKQLGGEIGGLVLGIGGQAAFVRGEETVVFLETRPRDGTFYTSALWQGKFTVERSTGNPAMAWPCVPRWDRLLRPGGAAHTSSTPGC